MLIEQVLPKDINIHNGLCGSSLGQAEKETIACNVIIISRANGNQWLPFTWEDYKARCEHKVTETERRVLDELVKSGHLACTDGAYSVTDDFIVALWNFVTNKK